MNDDTTPQQPVDEPPTAVADPATPDPATPDPKRRVRDRVFGFRSMLAVGLAGVILGGAVGTTITAVAHDEDRGDRTGQVGWRDDMAGDGDRGDHGPPMGGMPGMPPGTPPDEGTQPEVYGGDASGGTNS